MSNQKSILNSTFLLHSHLKIQNKFFSAFNITAVIFLFLSAIIFTDAQAQFYQGSQMNFGKNRVQYSDFFWTFYRTKRFDTYFYLGGKELAMFTAKSAEENLEKIEKIYDFKLDGRIQFIIFNKLSDLKQSNIKSPVEESGNIGGVTKIIGSKVFLYFDGNHDNFEKQIKSGIAQILTNQLLFGGDLKDMLQNAALLTLPDWYISGLVSYISNDWDVYIDNRVKDGIVSRKYRKFNRLSGEDAIYAGHSIWKYITDQYGEQSISNLLYMTRINRNIESGFLFVLGVSSKSLSKSWYEYYQKKYEDIDRNRENPATKPLVKKPKTGRVYSQLKLSPDGKYAAFVTNDMGRYKVRLLNIKTSKAKTVLRGGYKSQEMKRDDSFPLLAWHPQGKILTSIRERKGKILLGYYYPDKKKKEQNPMFYMDKILDFSYSDNGQLLVMSAIQKGQSDIFVHNLRSHTYEQITNDIYDDLNPRFIQKSSFIVFSSNRTNDTLSASRPDSIPDMKNHDIFIYDYINKKRELKRMTNTPGFNELFPYAIDSATIAYLSDENGIINRYIARLDSTISHVDTIEHYRDIIETFPTTDYSANILSHEINHRLKKIGEITLSNNRYWISVRDIPKIEQMIIEPPNPTPFRFQMLNAPAPKPSDPVNEKKAVKEPPEESKPLPDSDTSRIDINNYIFQSGFPSRSKKPEKRKGLPEKKIVADTAATSPVITEKKEAMFLKQRNYETAFGTSYVVTQLDNSLLSSTYQLYTGGGAVFFNPGINFLFKLSINDLFEDYRITGGMRFSGNLESNEYFITAENLKKRLDKQIMLYRQKRIGILSSFTALKIYTHEAKYLLKWPFSDITAIRGTASVRNDKTIYLSTDLRNLQKPDINEYWGSLKLEFIFDNTISRGLNLYNGVRSKVFYEVFKQEKPNTTLSVTGFDFRYYQKVHREITFANRFAASTSFGDRKLIYYMGGVDNWFVPKFDTSIPIDNTQNYLYQTIATNMRGFYQNIRNGNSFVVVNSELRFPIFKYLINRPIKSDFIKNFQIAGFADAGTAWTGVSPYDSTNSLNNQVITSGPLTITLFTQREPVVAGYGFGLRSRVLGYFVRTDWSWGYEDGVIRPRIFYFSLSLDF